MKHLAILFRDRRDQLFATWQTLLKGHVSDEYRDVLESPIGAKIMRSIIEDLMALSQAEAYEIAPTWKRIQTEAAAQAASRASVGFELRDVMAALQQVRAAMWKVMEDAQVTGDLPSPGATMEEMRQVDGFLDRLILIEAQSFLRKLRSEPTPGS